MEGSCDAGKVEERSILLITANHGGVGVSQGPRLAFFSPLIGNEAQLPCSGPSRKGLDCRRSLGPARCDKFDGIAMRARGAGRILGNEELLFLVIMTPKLRFRR